MDRAKAISPLSIRTKLCATNEDRAGAGCLRPNFAPCLEVPSDKSPTAITNIGVAAHICAASSEGRRYLAHDTWLHVTRRAPPLGCVEIFPISRRGLGHRKAARACKPRLKQNGRFWFTVGFSPNGRGRVCRVDAVRFARYVLYSGRWAPFCITPCYPYSANAQGFHGPSGKERDGAAHSGLRNRAVVIAHMIAPTLSR